MSGVLVTHVREALCSGSGGWWWPVLIDGPLEGIPEPGSGHRRARIIVFIPASLRTNPGCISRSVLVLCNSAMYEATFYDRGLMSGVCGV